MEHRREVTKFKETLGGCFGLLIALVISMMYGGFVTTYLWNGIISPTFGLMTLTFWQGFGLDLFVGFLTVNARPKKDWYSTSETFVLSIVISSLFLLLGWIVIQFI